ncbi:DUF1080 domain-containing protein [Pontiellaceae bacterium B12227]|nr:DUF1080 domain-containing protein [Pontiellaceae bacterium B12227]
MKPYTAFMPISLIAAALTLTLKATAGTEFNHPDTSTWKALFSPDLSDAILPDSTTWSVKDGILTASADKAIWTLADYEHYVLDLEFMNDTNSNSGVVIYCTDHEGTGWIANSIEVQLTDDHGSKWKNKKGIMKCGAIFGFLAPEKIVVKKPGEWNRMTLFANRQQIDVVINGEHVTSMDMTKWTSNETNPDGSNIPSWLRKIAVAEKPTRGKIGLQGMHGPAGIWFRNIRVKQL